MIRVLLIVLLIPAAGFGIATWILSDINANFAAQGIPPIADICALNDARADGEIDAACREFGSIVLLQRSSVAAALAGVGLPVLFWLGSLVSGTDRKRVSRVFPPLTRLVVVLLSGLVIVQGAILTYAVYIGESYAFERVHFVVIAGFAIGTLVAAFALVRTAFSFGNKLQTSVTGRSIGKESAPKLHEFVGGLASKLDANPPKNIVIGLEPSFFVTNADVYSLADDKQLNGETLFLSAPLSRVLSEEELAAVVGHELGHFRGEDTQYSMKFAPVYAGMGRALDAMDMSDDDGLYGLSKLPAKAVLSYMYDVFSKNERTIGRERELLADQAGAEAATARALATALAKVSVYSGLWYGAQQNNLERLGQGKVTKNLSSVFLDSAKYDVEHARFDEVMDAILEKQIAHPTDTHPTFSERLRGLEIERNDLSMMDILPPAQGAISIIDNYAEIEEELTVFEHRLRVSLGHVEFPEDAQQSQVLNAIYMLAAAMVSADGKIDVEEIAVAEGIGQNLVEGFDPVDFREACNSDDSPAFIDLAELLKDVLDDEAKSAVLQYLEEVAKADGEVSAEEDDLLNKLSSTFGVARGG